MIDVERGRKVVAACVAGLTVGLVYRAGTSEGMYWLDDYQHLLISKYAPSTPSLLLDIWGRPLMTGVYVPAAQLGLGWARVTSLLLFGVAGVCVWRIQRRWAQPIPGAAVVLLFAQPISAQLAFGAMPQTLFSAVLGMALVLRTRGQVAASCVVASLLPLARLEGVIVLVVWALVLLVERRLRVVALLGTGAGVWWLGALVVHGDPWWLITSNDFVGRSRYAAAGWDYLGHAAPAVFGVGIALLALIGLASRYPDPLVPAVTVGLSGFYAVAWGAGAFGTSDTPIYLASIAIPVSLLAHHAITRPARPVWAVAAVALLALVGYAEATPLPYPNGSGAAVEMAGRLGPDASTVAAYTDPSFGWHANIRPSFDEDFGSVVSGLPACDLVLWDSWLGSFLDVDMAALGYRPVDEVSTRGERQVLLVREPCDRTAKLLSAGD